ncbi:hypothetical protein HZS_8153, partial [Henneguya salminicola]
MYSDSFHVIPPEIELRMRKTVLHGTATISKKSRHSGSFPLSYTLSDQNADNTTYEFDFTLLNGMHLFEQVYFSIHGPITDTVLFVDGYKTFSFGFRVKISQNQGLQTRSGRYNSVECGDACGLPLFSNYSKMDYLCIQGDSRLYFLKIKYFDVDFVMKRVLLMKVTTRYKKKYKNPSKTSRTFITFPCSKNKSTRPKRSSNLKILVKNLKQQKISIHFIDVDRKITGPYYIATRVIHNYSYSEIKNNPFRVTGFTLINIDSLPSKSKYRNAIFMIPQNITYTSCLIHDR